MIVARAVLFVSRFITVHGEVLQCFMERLSFRQRSNAAEELNAQALQLQSSVAFFKVGAEVRTLPAAAEKPALQALRKAS